MTLIVLLAGALMLIAFPGHSASYPGLSAWLGGSAIEGLDCEPAPAGSKDPLELARATRTAGFAQEGSYICQRPVFGEGERNVFIEHLLIGETTEAQRAGAALRAEHIEGPISVKVTGIQDGEILKSVAALYRTELTSALGAGQVAVSGTSLTTLWVELHASDDARYMSTLRLHTARDVDSEGLAVWRTL